MTPLSLHPKVISLANTLRIDADDAVNGIRQFCVDRVRHEINTERITDIEALQRVLCAKLNLTVHEIWSDSDVNDLTTFYLGNGEPVFAFLKDDLNSGTYGILIRLKKQKGKQFHWAAVVDCRGEKKNRRFFTIWHEIVHCITAADQYELPFHRTKVSVELIDPLERLTDVVAADLAFFDPLFHPILDRQIADDGRLTFGGVQEIRDSYYRGASFESTLNACVFRSATPVILIRAELGLKKSERAAIESPQAQLFPMTPPIARLRVISAIANDAARAQSFRIHRNMRVPQSSIINLVFSNPALSRAEATENLNDWSNSDGGTLASIDVSVEAQKIGDQVIALIAPV